MGLRGERIIGNVLSKKLQNIAHKIAKPQGRNLMSCFLFPLVRIMAESFKTNLVGNKVYANRTLRNGSQTKCNGWVACSTKPLISSR